MQNSVPAFTKNAWIPVVVPLAAANTSSSGAGNITTPTIYKIATAGADGGFLDFVRFMLTATVAGTSSTATVARVYLSSITTGATSSADTILVGEVALPATVGDSTTLAQNPIDIPCGFRVPAGWTILVSIHAAPAANTAWVAMPFGGDF